MKITGILLFVAFLNVHADGIGQGITISEKDASLTTIFSKIRKQTGYQFLFNDQDIQWTKKVTIKVKDATIDEVLSKCFTEQPFEYSIKDKTIIIRKREIITRAIEYNTNTPPIDISGRVINSKGEPIVGATIQLQNQNKSTITNFNGEFIIQNISSNSNLEISSVGYETKMIPVSNKKVLTVILNYKVNNLDETVIIAYGTTTKRLNTGNISVVKGVDLENQPVNNVLLGLQGRVPGMHITQNNGLPGSGVTINIRGKNSISNGNDPLYVIDGVPYTSQLLPGSGSALILGNSGASGINGGAVNGNPMNYINISDIESIEILKDADATAIYGSRAANGAVLITLKRGRQGQTKVELNTYTGFGKVSNFMELLNTTEYLKMRKEAIINDGLTVSQFDYDINGLLWDTTRDVNWQKELIGGTSRYHDVQLSVAGGNNSTQYRISGGYHAESTVFPGDLNDKKYSIHYNINHLSTNNKFRIQFSGAYLKNNNRLQQIDLTGSALSLPPNSPALYNDDGTLNWEPGTFGFSSWLDLVNPLAYQNKLFKRSVKNLLTNGNLSYRLLNDLNLNLSLGYTDMDIDDLKTEPFSALDPFLRPTSLRSADYSTSNISSWIIEPQISYKKRINNHNIEALIGSTINQIKSNVLTIRGTGYNSDVVLEDPRSAASTTVGRTINSEYKYNALFGRIQYNYSNKYLINLSGRRDGSSRFGPENKFHNFGAIGVGWILSNESFIKNKVPFINHAKLRASYGSTGNDQIGDYSYLDLYSAFNVTRPFQGVPGYTLSQLTNPYLQWEETIKKEVGLEIELLRNRIFFSVSYYNNSSSNQLVDYPLPSTTGFNSILFNLPAKVKNYGYEITANITFLKTKNFSYSSSINLTIPKNKLVSFPNIENSSFSSSYIIGQPITIIPVFDLTGVNDSSGVYEFRDLKGNSTTNPNPVTDKMLYINLAPSYYGGFQNKFSYKGLELDVLFHFVKQMGRDAGIGFFPVPGYIGYNQPKSVLNRWQKQGDNKNVQQFNSTYSLGPQYVNATSSNAYYSDASFIRLKNISLSYMISNSLVNKIAINSCRIYFHAQNVLTITNYKGGLDPENQSTSSLPPLRVLTLGLNIGL